jgi:hypothetical protein
LAQQPFKPSSGGTETNTDPNLSLGGVSARQLALKINNVVSGNYAGFAEIQIYQLPAVLSLANSAATGVAATTAALNATLACTGSVYRVEAFWNTVNGGTDAGLWTNSASVGSWTNVALTNLSLQVSGLSPASTYYFTFRATNAVDTLWAANVQSFTTLASTTPPTPVLPGSAITFSNGAPTFTFGTVAGYKYRLDYKNALLDATWQPVIAPGFPPPNGWSATSTGGNMSLSDTNTVGQSQRFYRLESANP